MRSRYSKFKLQSSKWILSFVPLVAGAQAPDDAPPLLEPLPEIPPTFWEQYGMLVVMGILVLTALWGLLIWWWWQPKSVVPEPIEIQTRRELETLGRVPINGLALSRLSQCLRRYFTAVLELPAGEMTTTEFNRALREHREKIGDELVGAVGDFFRRADEQKFAPSADPIGGNAAQQALELFERAEKRRIELQQPVAVP